jgi:hypothetical protein
MARLEPSKARAVGALGEVIAQPAPLLAPEPAIQRLRHGELRLGARQLLVELLRE